MKIKICGIGDEKSLQATMAAGADFFGLAMVKESPRYVDVDMAKHLLLVAGDKIKSVLFLVNPRLDEVGYLAKELNPFALQLHGDESPDLCLAIKNQTNKKIIKVIKMGSADDISQVKNYLGAVDYIMFDKKPSQDDKRAGGLGKVFDWTWLQSYDAPMPFFLAGGLTIDNVAAAKTALLGMKNFFAVDVSSGVEQTLGKKSPSKIKDFCRAVRAG